MSTTKAFGADRLTDFLAAAQMALAARYPIERELGRGGMAIVYLARDPRHGRSVAVKVLRPELAASLGAERFLREIQTLARLNHPHILPLHDSGEAAGLIYYVMPYVRGETLRDRLSREGALPLEDALQITREVASALAFAHGLGVIHRDIKPENILLAEGHAIVADFGIARAVTLIGGEKLTKTGLAVGTPAYMSPEQAGGSDKLDGRSDIYALGCTLYEMLAGDPPFTGPNAQAILARHSLDPVPRLRTVRDTIPHGVEQTIMKALAKVPADRFATAAQFAEALSTSGSVGTGKPWRLRPRWRWVAVIGAVGVLGAVLVDKVAQRASSPVTTAASGRRWILVADFDGPPSDPALAVAARDLVATELEQSEVVNTVPRDELLTAKQLAGIPDTARLDAALARQLAYRSAVRGVVEGSLTEVGSANYFVVLRVVDAADGGVLLSQSGTANRATFIATLGQLARQLRVALGERREAIAAKLPLYRVTTPSFDAYRKYVEANELQDNTDYAGSNTVLREALALDGDFASAWALIGLNYLSLSRLDSARLAFAEALRRPARLSSSERHRLEALAQYATAYDIPAAIKALDLHLQQYPASVGGHLNRGVFLRLVGRYEEALRDFTRAAELSPFEPSQRDLERRVESLLTLGRLDEARQVAESLEGPVAQGAALTIPVVANQWSRADSVASALLEDPAAPAWLRFRAAAAAASAQAARGAVEQADRTLGRARSLAVAAGATTAALSLERAQLLLRVVGGRPIGGPGLSAGPPSTVEALLTRGLWAAAAGDTIAAKRYLRMVRARTTQERAPYGSGPAQLEAWLAARGNRWQEVVGILGPVAWEGEHGTFYGNLPMRWLVADAYDRLGHPDSAAAWLEPVVGPPRMPGNEVRLRGITYAFAHRRLGLWYAQLGQTAAARRHLRAFLDAFTNPDPPYRAMVTEAGAALARLEGQ